MLCVVCYGVVLTRRQRHEGRQEKESGGGGTGEGEKMKRKGVLSETRRGEREGGRD